MISVLISECLFQSQGTIQEIVQDIGSSQKNLEDRFALLEEFSKLTYSKMQDKGRD